MKAEEAISKEFLRSHPVEAARALEGVAVEDSAALLESSQRSAAAAVLQNMESFIGARCMAAWSNEFLRDVLTSLPISHTARMLRLMDASDRDRILSLASPETARALRALMQYPEGTAASWMNPRYVAYPQDLLVGEAWKRLRRRRSLSGYYVYVVDLEGVLVGALSFHVLMSANPRLSLNDVMSAPVESIPAHASGRTILDHPGWRRFPELPVVGESGVLLGLIQYSTFRELELVKGEEIQSGGWNTAIALGELYWSGSSHLLRGLAETVRSVSPRSPIEEKSDER